MTAPPDLARVLEDLDFWRQGEKSQDEICANAARLLRSQAEALNWLSHKLAEEWGGAPDWWHDQGCPEDDTCRCKHPNTIEAANRLIGPP